MLSSSQQSPPQPSVVHEKSAQFQKLYQEISKVIVGQESIVTFVALSIICNGHVLLEGVPGVAKTTLIKAFTRALGLSFNRIQFTPDMLPADVVGTEIYSPKTQAFEIKKGPVFANLILADEVNRAPAKVQSALLESMQEHQVTLGTHSFALEEPFIVFATQNPIEQEGTYKLPEAQLDRFLFKLIVSYPNKQEERSILQKRPSLEQVNPVMDKDEILTIQKVVSTIFIDEKVVSYIIDIIFATRNPGGYGLTKLNDQIQYGVSPRATIAFSNASKAHAFLQGRDFVTPDDVKAVTHAILRHRIVLSYEAEADSLTPDTIINTILQTLSTP